MRRLTRRLFVASLVGLPLLAIGWHRAWTIRRVLIRAGLSKPPANLLRNAAFLQTTIPGVPDYWGTDAAARIGSLDRVWSLESDAPVPGARSLRLLHPSATFNLRLMACRAFVPENRPYTLSVYLRTDRESHPVRLLLGWGTVREVTIGSRWARYHVSCTPSDEVSVRGALEARFGIPGGAPVWLAAPQLEAGSEPTPFVTALMDDHPLPDARVLAAVERRSVASSAVPESGGAGRFLAALRPGGRPRVVSAIAIQDPQDWQLADIAAAGFDAVAPFTPVFRRDPAAESPGVAARKIFDAAARHGLGVIGFLTANRPTRPADFADDAMSLVCELKSHPALLGWQYLDEPTHRWTDPRWDEIASLYAAIKACDPDHPVFLNDNRWPAGGGATLRNTDVGCLDVYPIGQYRNAVSLIGDASWRLNRDCSPAGKPTALWLQLYGYDDAVREPTFEEARAMLYAAIVHGTSLLMHWLFRPTSSRLWNGMRTITAELRNLGDVLLGGDAAMESDVITKHGVHASLWRQDVSHGYLVACNPQPGGAVAALDISRLVPSRTSSVRAWFGDGGRHAVIGRTLWLWLPAHGRQVFTLEVA